ncbi:hypothetical protein EJB05_54221, partial [Eragrostis curvula]
MRGTGAGAEKDQRDLEPPEMQPLTSALLVCLLRIESVANTGAELSSLSVDAIQCVALRGNLVQQSPSILVLSTIPLQHNQHKFGCISSQDILGLSDITLEPVIGATFLTFIPTDIISLQDAPYLKAAVTFAPHASLEDIVPANNSSAILAIEGEKRYCLHRDITLEKLKEIMLPKAIDYFCQNADATVYQMIWQSDHGSVLIHFEKERMGRPRTGGARKRKLLQGQEQGSSGTSMISRLLDLWGAHMPIRLRSFFTDWMQKQKEGQFTAQQAHSDHAIWKIIDNGSI